jgi:hypothetical protein
VFENFPVDFSLDRQHGGLELSNVRSAISEDYPLVVVVAPGGQLSITLKYRCSRFSGTGIDQLLKGLETMFRAMPGKADSAVMELEEALDEAVRQERLKAQRRRQESNVGRLRKMRARATGLPGEADPGPESKREVPGG